MIYDRIKKNVCFCLRKHVYVSEVNSINSEDVMMMNLCKTMNELFVILLISREIV